MIIKDAVKRDLPSIMALIRSGRGDEREISYDQFLVAKDKDRIIGCIRVKNLGDCLELGSLVVMPKYRNKGIGGKLVKSILTKDKRRPIYLLCFAETANFYSKAGFRKISVKSIPKALRNEYLLVKDKLKQFHRRIVAMVID